VSRHTALLAHPDAFWRSVIAAGLQRCCEVEHVSEAAHAAGLLRALRPSGYHLVILSEKLENCAALCSAVKEHDASSRVLVVGAGGEALSESLEAGAEGYVTEDEGWDAFAQATTAVLQGRAYVPPGMLAPLLRRLIDRNREADRVLRLFMSLTPRERQIVELLTEGCGSQEVADILVISPQTARTHVQNVIAKFGVHSRVEVVALVAEHGLIERMQRRGA
jgi:DNA-binding NarL/FixJ family response regulator